MKEILLKRRGIFHEKSLLKEYTCEITEFIDMYVAVGLPLCNEHTTCRHYILDTRDMYDNHIIAIRFPGFTLGSITIDDNNVILDISLDNQREIENHYNSDKIKDLNEKYVGSKLIGFTNERKGVFKINYEKDKCKNN